MTGQRPEGTTDARHLLVQGRSFSEFHDRRASSRRPRSKLLGVPYCPDVLDPVACDVERENRHGDTILLSHQTGLTVDRTLQERQVECPTGDIDAQARDLLAAFDWAKVSDADEAAAVGDRRRGGQVACADGLEVAASSPHAAVAKATAVKIANEREDLIGRAYEGVTRAYRYMLPAITPVRWPS
jgi:hypothetical protein